MSFENVIKGLRDQKEVAEIRRALIVMLDEETETARNQVVLYALAVAARWTSQAWPADIAKFLTCAEDEARSRGANDVVAASNVVTLKPPS